MATTNDELLAQLFALRAGLSSISIETERVKDDERAIEDEQQKVTDIYAESHKMKKQEDGIKSRMESMQSLYQMSLNSRDKDIEEKTKSECYGKEYRLKTLIACGLSLFFSIPMIILLATSTINNPMPIIVIVVCMIIFIVAIAKYSINVKKVRDKFTAEVDNIICECAHSIEAAQLTLSASECKRRKLSQKINEVEQQRDCNIETYNDSIVAHTAIAMSYNSVLEERFGTLLNPADWKNIDLCIYYLQTGRAESLKECLQLVDRQLQTNEIINTVRQASDRICDEIHSGFNALGKTMVKCFNSVSAQIESLSNQVANEHTAVINALDSINNSNAAILSATQLNNALLAKAGASSEQLADDLRYIKQYA